MTTVNYSLFLRNPAFSVNLAWWNTQEHRLLMPVRGRRETKRLCCCSWDKNSFNTASLPVCPVLHGAITVKLNGVKQPHSSSVNDDDKNTACTKSKGRDTRVVRGLDRLRVSGVPVTGADAQAATLGQISQVLLSLPHVLVDLVHALVHTPQLL